MKSSQYWDKRALNRLSTTEKNSEKYIKRIKSIYNRTFKKSLKVSIGTILKRLV